MTKAKKSAKSQEATKAPQETQKPAANTLQLGFVWLQNAANSMETRPESKQNSRNVNQKSEPSFIRKRLAFSGLHFLHSRA